MPFLSQILHLPRKRDQRREQEKTGAGDRRVLFVVQFGAHCPLIAHWHDERARAGRGRGGNGRKGGGGGGEEEGKGGEEGEEEGEEGRGGEGGEEEGLYEPV